MNRSRLEVMLALVVFLSGCTGALLGANENSEQSGLQYLTADDAALNYVGTPSQTFTGGGGAYVTDFNNDGWPDVLLLGGRMNGTDHRRPVLYKNIRGKFEPSAALPVNTIHNKTTTGALFFDYDYDGWDDLLLLAQGDRAVFLQNNNGTFQRKEVGLEDRFENPVGASAADYDRDGRLDVFVFQNGDWLNTTPAGYNQPDRSIIVDNGNPNRLYRWNGSGFERTEEVGIGGDRWSLAASFVDLNNDGWPDMHVANDFNHDQIYINNQDGTFEDVQLDRVTNRNGMSSEIEDINGDGQLDIFVTNIYIDAPNMTGDAATNYVNRQLGKRVGGNNLLINDGNGSFDDRAEEFGVRKGGWGWSAVVADLDNDGDRDLFHSTKRFTNSFVKNGFRSEAGPYPSLQYPAVWERNRGTFEAQNGSDVGFNAINGRGVASLDFDRDGDLDLVTTTWSGGRYRLYENRGSEGKSVEVRVRPNGSGTVVGTEVFVTVNNQTQIGVMNSKADYRSQDTRTLHFGVGEQENVDRIRVVWPSGDTQTLTDLEANTFVTVPHGGNTTVINTTR